MSEARSSCGPDRFPPARVSRLARFVRGGVERLLACSGWRRRDQPSLDWLANCRWVWRRDRLDQIVAAAREHDPPSVWLCGWAANQVDFIDVFDAVFLLDIDEQTMLRRVGNESRGNDFGRVGDSLPGLIASRTTVQDVWRQRGAIPINATQPPDDVLADHLLAAAVRLRRIRS